MGERIDPFQEDKNRKKRAWQDSNNPPSDCDAIGRLCQKRKRKRMFRGCSEGGEMTRMTQSLLQRETQPQSLFQRETQTQSQMMTQTQNLLQRETQTPSLFQREASLDLPPAGVVKG